MQISGTFREQRLTATRITSIHKGTRTLEKLVLDTPSFYQDCCSLDISRATKLSEQQKVAFALLHRQREFQICARQDQTILFLKPFRSAEVQFAPCADCANCRILVVTLSLLASATSGLHLCDFVFAAPNADGSASFQRMGDTFKPGTKQMINS